MARFDIRGTTVLITGGAGVLGQAYAERAVGDGARHVVLWGLNENALQATAARLSTAKTRVSGRVVDVTDEDAVERAAEQVLREDGGVDVLVNNAGVVRAGYFWEQDSASDIAATMRVNALAPMQVTRAFLGEMLLHPDRPRRLLTVSSAAATMSNPRMAVYAASKWAALAWSDSLRLELEQAGHRHIRVTTFCPSYIDTGMFDGAGGVLWTRTLHPADAADASWRAMLAGRPILLKPWTVQLGKVLRGLLPVPVWDAAAGSFLGIYHSMDQFTGRRGSSTDADTAVPDATEHSRAQPHQR